MKKYIAFLVLSLVVLCMSMYGTFRWISGTESTKASNDLLIADLQGQVSGLFDGQDGSELTGPIVSDLDEDRVKADKQSLVSFFEDMCGWTTGAEYKAVRRDFIRSRGLQESFALLFLPDRDMDGFRLKCDVVSLHVASIADDTYSYLANVYWYVIDDAGCLNAVESVVLFRSDADHVLSNFEAY